MIFPKYELAWVASRMRRAYPRVHKEMHREWCVEDYSSVCRSTDYGSTYERMNDKVGVKTVLSYLYVCPTNKRKVRHLLSLIPSLKKLAFFLSRCVYISTPSHEDGYFGLFFYLSVFESLQKSHSVGGTSGDI